MKKRKGELAKERILKAATIQFAERGYAETSIQSIADSIGMSQTSVLYHFPQKIQLFEEVVKNIIEDRSEKVEASNEVACNAYERLVQHFAHQYDWAVKDQRDSRVMASLYYFAAFDERFLTLYRRVLVRARDYIYSLIREGCDAGLFKPKADLEQVTQILHDHMLGSLINANAEKDNEDNFNQAKSKWKLLVSSFTQFTPNQI